jgi:hypothetical protein
MELRRLGDLLGEKKITVNLKEMKDSSVRLYVRIDVQFTIYFIQWDGKPFLKVYINRGHGYDYKGQKQSELENQRCRKAKFQILKAFAEKYIPEVGLEQYGTWENVKLYPTEGQVKINIGELI